MAARTGSQVVIDALVDAGVTTVFGYPGGAIMPFYDALLDSPLQHILTRHEQSAIHAADGFARATGRMGVCIATSGPGATNLITGICTSAMDSTPVLCITGQVPTALIGTDAFQEADLPGIVTAVADLNDGLYQVTTVEGNMSSTVKCYTFIYDSGKANAQLTTDTRDDLQRNMSAVPAENQTDPLTQYELSTDYFTVFGFGATWL